MPYALYESCRSIVEGSSTLLLRRSLFLATQFLLRVLERGFPDSNSRHVAHVAQKCRRVQEPLEIFKRSGQHDGKHLDVSYFLIQLSF